METMLTPQTEGREVEDYRGWPLRDQLELLAFDARLAGGAAHHRGGYIPQHIRRAPRGPPSNGRVGLFFLTAPPGPAWRAQHYAPKDPKGALRLGESGRKS